MNTDHCPICIAATAWHESGLPTALDALFMGETPIYDQLFREVTP